MLSKLIKHCPRAYNLHKISSQSFASAEKAGNLYTWGLQVPGLGYQAPYVSEHMYLPKRVEVFENNVKKVAAGPNHTAVITIDGDLYTFGVGRALGHGDGYNVNYLPKRVDFFKNSGLKVKDVAVGAHHTIALTENDEVWSWGSGGGSTSFIVKLFLGSTGVLGQPNNANRGIPTLIEALKGKGPFKQITSGYEFAFALTEKGDVYHWGKSKYGVLADLGHQDVATPVLNKYFAELKDHDHLEVVKIRSCSNYSVAQLSNGKLVSWGADIYGQLGLDRDLATEWVEEVAQPEEVIDKEYHGKKILDFQVSENLLLILTEDHQIYYSGLRYYATPFKHDTGAKKLNFNKIAAGDDSFAVLTDKNELLSIFGFLPIKKVDYDANFEISDTHAFGSGEVLDFGGAYKTRYAIVKN